MIPMQESVLFSECWRYESTSGTGDRQHVHLALVNALDVYVVLRMATVSGRWQLVFTHPFTRQGEGQQSLYPVDVAVADFDQQRSLLRGEVRKREDNLSAFQLWGTPCNISKVGASIHHLEMNEDIAIFSPSRDGWPEGYWLTSRDDWFQGYAQRTAESGLVLAESF